MNDNWITPQIGKTCPALTKEDYEYHLSGDTDERYCLCILNDEPCKGRVVADTDDQSSQFFSRARCYINTEKIKSCPLYGMGKETFKQILKERHEKLLNEKLNELD